MIAHNPLVAITAQTLPLAGAWRFTIDPEDVGERQGWAKPGLDDTGWEIVNIPHTWNVVPAYKDYEGIAWYRLVFTAPAEGRDALLRLRFGAVFYLARVWLNGQYLGQHEGGYTPFEFEASELLIPGAENLLAVQVDNLRATNRLPADLYEGRSFGWNNYGGIVREATLEITSRVFIARQQIVAVPHLSGVAEADTAAIKATVAIRNASNEAISGRLLAKILVEDTRSLVAELGPTSPVRLPPGQSVEVALETTLAEPKLWHFDRPNLYRWAAVFQDSQGQNLHTAEEIFGIRLIELKQARFYLNGEPVRLAGLSRHADSPAHGLAETVAVMAADYADLKTLNTVFARPVHYPQHEFILDYCDRRGILLCPELPAWQLTAGQMEDPHLRRLAKQQLREMIAASYNHPSIWSWSVGNELESDTVAGRAYVRDMVAYVKTLDATRPVSFASYHLLVGRPWADASQFADFVMMNQYFGTWHGPKDALGLALDAVHATWPEKTVFVSEFGFMPHWQRIEGPARIDPAQYYLLPEDASPESDEADLLRQQVIAEQMEVIRSRPFVAGALLWCYQGIMGVVNDDRNRRGSWEVLRQAFAPLVFEAVTIGQATSGKQYAQVRLRTRGPAEADLPAYTLRDYRLRWEVASRASDTVFCQGEMPLPMLPPGSAWSGEIEWEIQGGEHVLGLSIIRPTGFCVIEGTWDLKTADR